MKIFTKKEKGKQSLLTHNQIRKAEFVPVEESQNKKFIYKLVYKGFGKAKQKLLNLKRSTNSVLQKPRLLLQKVDWRKVSSDAVTWIFEASIEGLSINFAFYVLLGSCFSIWTVLAYGLLIKQTISIWWRLKRNGTTSTIHKRDNKYS